MFSTPFMLLQNKIWILGRWKHNTSVRVHPYYISLCPWAVQEPQSCKSVFPLMSFWSRGRASVTGHHRCSLPVRSELSPSNLPQDSKRFIYCTWRFYAELIFNIFSCVEHPITHLSAVTNSSCIRLICMNEGFLGAPVPKVTCGHTGAYSQSL